jgi:hypothetical protein
MYASSTFRRWIAVLTFGFFGASMAFLLGARAGAALNGTASGVTFVGMGLTSSGR